MATGDNKAEISIGAKIDEATAAIAELKGQFESFAKDVSGHMNEIGSASDALLGNIKELTAGFLSFEGAKKAVEQTRDLAIEAEKLGSIFGMGRGEASQFAVAIEDVHASVGNATQAAAFMARGLRQNEEQMQRFGLKTRDSSGAIRDQKEMFFDALKLVNEYREGVDRNIASQVFFGRGATEMQELLKMTAADFEHAKEKADELGLTLTNQGQKTVKDYRDAMQDAGDVFTAMQKIIGEALMPILTALGKWLSENGKDALSGFKVAVDLVVTAINGLVLVFQILYEVFHALVTNITSLAVGFGDVLLGVVTLDPARIKRAAAATGAALYDSWTTMFQRIVDKSQETKDRLTKLWSPDESGAAGGAGTGGRKAPVHDNNLLAQLEARLADKKAAFEAERAAEGQYMKFSLQDERDYWLQYVNDARLNTQERLKVRMKAAALETEIGRQAFAAEIADLQAQEANYKKNLDARLAISEEIARKIAYAMGPDSPAAKAAQKAVNENQRRILEQQKQMSLDAIDQQSALANLRLDSIKNDADREFALRKLSQAQLLGVEKSLAEQRFEIDRDVLERKIALEESAAHKDKALLARLYAEREKMTEAHVVAMGQIESKLVIENQKYATEMSTSFQDSVAQMFDVWNNRTKSASEVFKNFTNSVLANLSQIAAKKLAAQLVGPGTSAGSWLDKIFGSILGNSAGGAVSAVSGTATGLSVPGFSLKVPSYDVGTPYVPRDQLALIHKGERITPAGQNAGLGPVTNNFVFSGPVSKQTQEQVALAAARGLQRALSRSG